MRRGRVRGLKIAERALWEEWGFIESSQQLSQFIYKLAYKLTSCFLLVKIVMHQI